jgi:hypothetical protein
MLLGAAPALADNTTFHATANGSVATTDNASGAETGSPNREADMFTDVRPGMLLTYNAPRMIHELMGEVDFLYHLGAAKPSVTFRSGWKSFFTLTPLSELSVNADASMGQLNSLGASAIPGETPTQVVPLGRVETTNVSVGEQTSFTSSEAMRTWQRGFTAYTTTDDTEAAIQTQALEVGGSLGVARTLRHDSFQLEGGASYLHLERLDPMMVQTGNRLDRQLNPRGVFIWQHDVDRHWSTNLDAGVVYVNPVEIDPYNPDDERKSAFFPIFGGLAAYTDVWGRATLNVRRAVLPNLLLAENTVSDSVVLTAAMPLTFLDRNARRRAPNVVGIGSAGLERMQMIDSESGSLQGEFNVVRVDVGVGWSVREGATFGLRYELTYQTGDTVAEMVVPTFFRNTFYFTFALRYPEEVTVRVPRRGQSVRADRGDLAPIGSEPVILDPGELLEQGGR